MTHDVQAIREDLAFMLALAQEGRRAPLLIGHSLLAGGIIYGLASIFAWAVSVQVLALPFWWEGAIWPLATVIYIPYARYRRIQCQNGRPGATAVTNRAVSAVWRGIGFAIMALGFAGFIAAYQMKTAAVFALFPSIVLAIYGAGWLVALAMSETKWLKWVAYSCFAASVALGAAANSHLIYLFNAVALFLLMALPGWLLLRAEPSDIV
jgi:hypothetical protein